jgi:hypothetical protein
VEREVREKGILIDRLQEPACTGITENLAKRGKRFTVHPERKGAV